VREYHAQGGGVGMCTARPGWQTISPQNMSYFIAYAQMREYHAQGGGVGMCIVHGPARLADHLTTEHVLFIAYAQVREYHAQGGGVGMCTARPGWQTISPQNMSYKSRMHPVKVRINNVLYCTVPW
jgi:hypothetical protein